MDSIGFDIKEKSANGGSITPAAEKSKKFDKG
jgi:hypothetical protein